MERFSGAQFREGGSETDILEDHRGQGAQQSCWGMSEYASVSSQKYCSVSQIQRVWLASHGSCAHFLAREGWAVTLRMWPLCPKGERSAPR